jgi:hypothetical protein
MIKLLNKNTSQNIVAPLPSIPITIQLSNIYNQKPSSKNVDYNFFFSQLTTNSIGGRWSGKYVGTTCLRATGSSSAPPAVWVFWRLIWRTESLNKGLILVCRFSFVSSRECIPVAAQTCSLLDARA